MIDVVTGERIVAHVLDGYESAYAVAVAPDETVYIEARPGGHLMHYLPAEDRIVDLGRVTAEANQIPMITIDRDGVVWGGTATDAHIFSYRADSEKFTDHGLVAEGETYARVGANGDGVIYAGTSNAGLLFALDAEDGNKIEIPLPEPYASTETRAIPVAVQRGRLFVFGSPSGDALVYDIKGQQWIAELPRYGSDAEVSDPIDDKVYAEDLATNRLWAYDLDTDETTLTDFSVADLGTPTKVIGVVEFDDADFPGRSLVGIGLSGRIWHWNPATGAERWLDGDVQGSPAKIRSIGHGLDGNIYVSGHFTSGTIARYVIAEDRLEQLPGPVQVEGFGVHDGKLYLGTYTGAVIMVYDPAQPWDYGTNPRTLFSLGDQGQDRPWELVGIGNRIAIGTTAKSGSLNGALTFYTPATNEVNAIGTLFENHGVTALAARDQLLAGGSSTQVDGTPPVETTAKLFLWDAATDQLLWSGEPFDDAAVYPHLVFDDAGFLWGLTNKTRVFRFDVDTREVVDSVLIQPDAGSTSGMPVLFIGPDGAVYGSTQSQDSVVFRVDPSTMGAEILDTEAGFACLGADNNLYYAKNKTSLYRMPLDF